MTAEWQVKRLGEVCKLQNGFAFKSKLFRASGTPVLRISSIQNELVSDNRPVFIDPNDYKEDLSKYDVHDGDLLIAMSGATTGKAFVLNQRVGKFVPSNRLNIDFLFFFLITKVEENLEISAGSAQPNLSTKQIKNFLLPLPPLPEQKRIVAILDEAFAGISQAVANAEKNLANARALFESTLNKIFTQKGERWVEKKLGEVCSIKHGFAFKSQFFSADGNYVLLTPGSFYEDGGFRSQGKKTKYYTGEIPTGYILDEGNFLIAMIEQAVGLLGSSLNVPKSNYFLHNQRLGFVQVNNGMSWENDFFHHQFNTRYFRNAVQATASGVKVRHTSPKKLEAISISFPESLSEQEKIASLVNEMKSETQRLETLYQQKLTALAELKQSILQKAFSGELTMEQEVMEGPHV